MEIKLLATGKIMSILYHNHHSMLLIMSALCYFPIILKALWPLKRWSTADNVSVIVQHFRKDLCSCQQTATGMAFLPSCHFWVLKDNFLFLQLLRIKEATACLKLSLIDGISNWWQLLICQYLSI